MTIPCGEPLDALAECHRNKAPVNHVMEKLGANERTLAIAGAVRGGVVGV